jgi:hypothetical protein
MAFLLLDTNNHPPLSLKSKGIFAVPSVPPPLAVSPFPAGSLDQKPPDRLTVSHACCPESGSVHCLTYTF